MDVQVLLVAPFDDLAELAETVIQERLADAADLIRVVKGDLEECVFSVKQAVEDGVEVIVSRGGTADLLEKHVRVPIVHIQVTLADMLQALRRNGEYPDRIGVAGFGTMIYGCEEMSRLLGVHLTEILIQNEQEAANKIFEAAQDGIQLIVGDAVSIKAAKRLNLPGELIRSGKGAILQALREALLIARIRREEQEKAEFLRTVIDHSAEGIVVSDASSHITVLNPAAEKIFKISHLEAVGRTLRKAVPAFGLLPENTGVGIAELCRINHKDFAVKYSEISVKGKQIGAIYTLQHVSQVQQLERSIRRKLHERGLVARYHMEDIAGISSACQAMKRKAGKYALTQSTILVTGESGTGKEMLVQSIHNISARAEGPFVAVNCAALPENLLESELFGYAEGAFTGAKKGGRQGVFELAHGGTLFLDEVGEMPVALQSRLLRVLQERAVMRLGGESVLPVDVRVIAATNQDLAKMVEEKTFRRDLYYRLNILRIHMPTLAQRQEDIPMLACQMVKRLQTVNPHVQDISLEARLYLRQREWPGNIRQLANTMERAMLLCAGKEITCSDVEEAYDDEGEEAPTSIERQQAQSDNLHRLEQETLQRVLAEERYNYSRAAQRLGVHRTTLWRKLNKK